MRKIIKKVVVAILICCIFICHYCGPITAIAEKGVDKARLTGRVIASTVSEKKWKEKCIGEYPINSDSPEWKRMSYKEALEACNMPEKYANSLATEQLVDYAVNYPFLSDILMFETLQDGIAQLAEKSTVFKELLSRDDYMDKLLEEYEVMECDYKLLEEENDIKKSKYEAKFFVEAYMGLNYKHMSNKFADRFVKAYDKKFVEQPESIRNYSMSSAFYQGISETMKYIPERAVPTNVKKHNILKEVSNELSFVELELSTTKRWFGGVYYWGYEIIDGKNVYCYQLCDDEYTDSEKTAIAVRMENNYPTFLKMKDATKKYNCHSYAWYSTSMYNNLWIDHPSPLYSDTDYYRKWQTADGIPKWESRILFYSNSGLQHSAIITSYPQCKSKLGSYGVYITTISDMEAMYGSTSTQIYLVK